jgi:hypothetical protein
MNLEAGCVGREPNPEYVGTFKQAQYLIWDLSRDTLKLVNEHTLHLQKKINVSCG